MAELLTKEQLVEIERRKSYQYGTMVSLTVAERDAIVAHCRALEAGLSEAKDELAVADDALETQKTWISELRAQLREVEASRNEWKEMHDKLAAQWSSWSGYADRKVEQFRLRAIEAVERHKGSHKPSANQDYEFGYYDALDRASNLLQSLPATSDHKDELAIAQQQAADLNHGD